jgi:hypothetical protein
MPITPRALQILSVFLLGLLVLWWIESDFAGTVYTIIVNVFSDLITLGLLAFIAWIFFVVRYRDPLMKFFNVRANKRVVVYLSNIRVTRSKGIDDIPRAYEGSAVVFGELNTVKEITNLFSYPFPASDNNSIDTILRKLRLVDVATELHLSPLTIEEIETQASIIAIGSPGYNIASRFCEEKGSKISFGEDNTAIMANNKTVKEVNERAFVSRIVDNENRRSLFYVAGVSEEETKGAIHHLIGHWEDLQRGYGDQDDFAVQLKIDQDDYRNSTIVNCWI